MTKLNRVDAQSLRFKGKREFLSYPKHYFSEGSKVVTQEAKRDYANRRGTQLRRHKAEPLHSLFKPIVTVLVAIIGALVCSASVQTATLTLPRWMRGPATPIIAGALVLGTEKIGRHTITVLRLKQQQQLERARLQAAVARVSDDQPMEQRWLEAQLELLETVESRPWPWLNASGIGLVFLVEAGAALSWVSQESIILALFAAAFPPTYVLLASLVLSQLLDGHTEAHALAEIYDEYLAAPDDVAVESHAIAWPEMSVMPVDDIPPVNHNLTANAVDISSNGHEAMPNVIFPHFPGA